MKIVYRITAVILLLIISVTAFTPCTVINAVDSADIDLSAELSDNGQYINFKLDMREGFSEFLEETYGSDELHLFSLLPYETTDDISYLLPTVSDIKNVGNQIIRLKTDPDSLYRSYFIAVKKVELIPVLPPVDEIPSEPNEDGPDEDNIIDSEDTDATAEPVYEEQITYEPITSPVFVGSQEKVSLNSEPYPTFSSKKGLDIQLLTDAQRLGVAHTVVNIPLNEYLTTDTKSEYFSTVAGENVYFDSNLIAILDHKVKVYSDAGINIIFNFVLTSPGNSVNEDLLEMYFEDRNDNADYYAVNVSNQNGYKLTRACAEFFTSRYSQISGKRGFVGSFIIGYEIDSNSQTNSMGPVPVSEYVSEYSKVLRIFTTAALTHYSNARIYISLSNSFSSPSTLSPDPTLNYSGRDILQILDEKLSDEGDIPWRLCVNPYSSDGSNVAFWANNDATDTADSPTVSMKNIGMLSKYLNQPLYYYNGSPRSILIGEIGFSSESGTAYDQTQQAAAFAYAYMKAESDPFIDAMIYHRQIDSEYEKGKFGLYSLSSSNQLTPKAIYSVFKDIDTASSDSVSAFALKAIGAENWGELITGYNSSSMVKRTVYTSNSVIRESLPSRKTDVPLIDLNESYFYPSDNVYSVEYSANSVKVVAYDTYSSEYRGIFYKFTNTFNEADFIKLKLQVTSDNFKGAADIMLRFTGTDKDGHISVYEGIGQINSNSEAEIYFPVSEYFKNANAESMKIWCKPFSDDSIENFSFILTDISVVTKGRNNATIFIIVLLVILAVVAIALLILFVKTSFKGKKKIGTPHHKKPKIRNNSSLSE